MQDLFLSPGRKRTGPMDLHMPRMKCSVDMVCSASLGMPEQEVQYGYLRNTG